MHFLVITILFNTVFSISLASDSRSKDSRKKNVFVGQSTWTISKTSFDESEKLGVSYHAFYSAYKKCKKAKNEFCVIKNFYQKKLGQNTEGKRELTMVAVVHGIDSLVKKGLVVFGKKVTGNSSWQFSYVSELDGDGVKLDAITKLQNKCYKKGYDFAAILNWGGEWNGTNLAIDGEAYCFSLNLRNISNDQPVAVPSEEFHEYEILLPTADDIGLEIDQNGVAI